MKVILLDTVRGLGHLGSIVDVKPGYGRNYLLPQGKAVSATRSNVEKFEIRRAELEKQAAELLKAAQSKATEIEAIGCLTITAKVAEEGKLYGSVDVSDVADAFGKVNVSLHKSALKLSSGIIRHVGEYEASVHLHHEVTALIKVNVVAEG